MFADDNHPDWVHVNSIPDQELGTEMMDDFLKELYNGGDLNVIMSKLEDIAGFFDINLPDENPNLFKIKE